jgi:hypothetical protein
MVDLHYTMLGSSTNDCINEYSLLANCSDYQGSCTMHNCTCSSTELKLSLLFWRKSHQSGAAQVKPLFIVILTREKSEKTVLISLRCRCSMAYLRSITRL